MIEVHLETCLREEERYTMMVRSNPMVDVTRSLIILIMNDILGVMPYASPQNMGHVRTRASATEELTSSSP